MATNVALTGSYLQAGFVYENAYVKINNISTFIDFPDNLTGSNLNQTSNEFIGNAQIYPDVNSLETSSRNIIDDFSFTFTSSASDADNPLYTQAYTALKLISPFDTFHTINQV